MQADWYQSADVLLYKGKWYIVPHAISAEGFTTLGLEWFTVDATEPAEKKGELVYEALRRSGKKLPYSVYDPRPRSQNVLRMMTGANRLTRKMLNQIWAVGVSVVGDEIRVYPQKKVSPWQALGKEPISLPYPSPPEKLVEAIIEAFRRSEPPPPEENLFGSVSAPEA
jgi:hypothetical protein